MLSPGKVEIGQGIVTALAQIAADELDVDIGRVQLVRASTAASPNEGVTSGSLSIQQSGRAIRQACAEIRQIFLTAAAARLGIDANALDISDGTIFGPGNVQTSYWELAEEISLDRDATLEATPKSAAKRALAGQSVQRVDLPDKVFARPRFIHDFTLPSMLHGRVLRPERSRARLAELNENEARTVAGLVAVVRDGSFAGIVSETEDGAETALERFTQGRDMVGRRSAARRKRPGCIPEGTAGGVDDHRHQDVVKDERQAAHDAAAIYPPLYRACLDRAVLRHGAMERRSRSRLDPQPGGLSASRRSCAGS